MSVLSLGAACPAWGLALAGLVVGCGGPQVVDGSRVAEPALPARSSGEAPPAASSRALQLAVDPRRSDAEIAATDPDPRRQPSSAGVCGGAPVGRLPARRGGNLTVESPPRPRERSFGSRMRADVDGALTLMAPRMWVGIEVPIFVQIASGTLELFLLDKVRASGSASPAASPDEAFLAFYRDPYDASSCEVSASKSSNCAFGAALYHCSGKLLWVTTLNPFMSRPDHLEVQDIRYDDGVLYFNEACQSYSKDAGGRCSSLVAVDPIAKKVLWRSAPLTSNNEFVVHGRYIIAGYGFTAEPDFLFVVRRSDGKVMQRLPVTTAHQTIRVEPDGSVSVTLYDGPPLRFMAQGFDGDAPKLVRLAAR